ncbi:hypothetical protein [Streptomyces soliscabiei]|uniref:hypothetical protein n=1 Tax=Streptomyces soliscabiei TaxID=588897 RepID=UPI0029A08715|nr:hypothetical protein [Streptomyces sp. NY05-11A]MDX2678065.1 hypothetical protein [Streptomyces sp. NY05-11A]
MEILPPRPVRVAYAAPWVVPAVGAVAYGAECPDALSWGAAAVVLALGGTLTVRGYRIGVSCEADRLVVRGPLWTRAIPRQRIRAVTDFPAVRWETAAGRGRWTPVTAFVSGADELASLSDAKAQCVARLRRWARRSGHGRG